MRKGTLPSISLYSGVGGLDIGLSRAGFSPRIFLDKDKNCIFSLKLNKVNYWNKCRKFIHDDIRNFKHKEILQIAGLSVGEAILINGGPPCQPFSKSSFWSPKRWADNRSVRPADGKSRPHTSYRGMDDDRAGLLIDFVSFIDYAKPFTYLIENVKGLSYKTSKPMLDLIIAYIEDSGYTVNAKVLNAADYGVPQKRERLFIIGAKDDIKLEFPKPTHFPIKKYKTPSKNVKPYITSGDAIGDLDEEYDDPDLIVGGKWGHLLPEIPPGDNYLYYTAKRGHPNPIFIWRSKYWSFLLKLAPDKPSWTIQAQPSPYVGPFHWRNRRLTLQEIKRLQTFPDNYQIFGNRKAAQRQLGDAVPPLLAEKIGTSIIAQIEKNIILNDVAKKT